MQTSTLSGKRPSLEVVDIFRLHGEEYKNHYPLSREQKKAMADITRCRTAGLGGHVDVCDQDYGFTRISYSSCRNRSSPGFLMNRPHTLKNRNRKNLFQRLTGKLCPISLIRDSDAYAKLKNTHSIYLDLEKTVSSTSNQSAYNALTHTPWNTPLD